MLERPQRGREERERERECSYGLLLVLQGDGTEEDLGAPQVLGVHLDQPVFGRLQVQVGALHGGPVHGGGGRVGGSRVAPGPVLRVLIGVFEVQVLLEPVGSEDLALRVVRRGGLGGNPPAAEAQVVLQPLGHGGSGTT